MIRVYLDGAELDIEFKTFAAGERNVEIKGLKQEWKHSLRGPSEGGDKYGHIKNVEVIAHIDSSDTLIDLVLVTDALKRLDKGSLRSARYFLHMPYIPYARQDRVMQDGQSLAIKPIMKIINMLEYDEVVVDDPHSDVSTSHIENVVVNEQFIQAIDVLGHGFFDGLVLVAPDSGAMKKTLQLAEKVGVTEVGYGIKHRDLVTNNISHTSYSGPDLTGKAALMVDDIIDGGRTFIELGKVLRENGAEKVYLFSTHGIFSYGLKPFEGVIDRIYCAYPWKKNVKDKNEKGILVYVDGTKDFE